MSNFKFYIKEYFNLPGEQIGLVGDMEPSEFPIVTSKYAVQLVKVDRILHEFKTIGEEIPARENNIDRVRAFRTADDIKVILANESLDELCIIGREI